MLVSFDGIMALRSLRIELQEDAHENYPQDVIQELLVLYDVCKKLELNIFQCGEVMGKTGLHAVCSYINSPISASTLNFSPR